MFGIPMGNLGDLFPLAVLGAHVTLGGEHVAVLAGTLRTKNRPPGSRCEGAMQRKADT